MESRDTDNILSLLDNYTMTNADDIARDIADNFRRRRVERNMTREELAQQSGVALANIARFEQKALISLSNLISLAMTLGYTSDIHSLFSQPKYSTMDELLTIRKNQKKKRARKNQTEKQRNTN
jgi:transcriptional regulator with XRE-family HTH domain